MNIRIAIMVAALALPGAAFAQNSGSMQSAPPANDTPATSATEGGMHNDSMMMSMTAEQKAQIKRACAADIQANCASVANDDAKLHQCMKTNKAKLSAQCTGAMREMRGS